jgi:TolB protein
MSLFLVSVVSGAKRPLTTAPGQPGDLEAAFSPDGRHIVFTRYTGLAESQVMRLDLSSDYTVTGDPIPIDTHVPGAHSPAWTEDGDLLLTSGWFYQMGVWRVDPFGGGAARRVPVRGLGVKWPVSNLDNRLLFYIHAERETETWEMSLSSQGRTAGSVGRMLGDSRSGSSLQYQPSGNRVAFLANRRGNVELWVSDRDGANSLPIVRPPQQPVNGPEWSPDGKRVLYVANEDGEARIYIVSAEGGPSVLLQTGPAEFKSPQWSEDGFVYFGSARSGQSEIWRINVNGGNPSQITKTGAFFFRLSHDDRFVFYSKSETVQQLWKTPVEGGAEELVFETPAQLLPHIFDVTDKGIYFAANLRAAIGGATIRFFEFNTGSLREVLHTPQPVFIGFAVSRDGRNLAYSQLYRSETSVVKVTGFE